MEKETKITDDEIKEMMPEQNAGEKEDTLTTVPEESGPAPSESENIPAETDSIPAEPEESPAEADAVPAEPEESPAEADAVPAEAEETPAEADAVPADSEETPAEADAVPAEAEETPAETDPTPAEPEESPAESDAAPAGKESLEDTAAAAAAAASAAAGGTGESGPSGSDDSGAGGKEGPVPAAGNRQDAEKGKHSKKEKHKKKHSAGRVAFRITMLLILLLLGGAYYYGYQYCGTHFMPGTRINTFDCSGLTEEEVQERFAQKAEDYVLNIRFRGGVTEMLGAEDIGFKYEPDGSIAALLQQQDQLVWPKYFFEDSEYDIEVGGAYDAEKLLASLKALPELKKKNMEKPKDAYLHFRKGKGEEDGAFEIVPETEGTTIDAVQLAAGLGDAASRYEEMVDAEQVAGAYVQADILQDDADLNAYCKDLNDTVGASITYVMPDGEEIKLNADVMRNWLVEDKKGRLVKDDDVWDEHLWEFLQELANHGNTLGMNRPFNSTLRGPITVSGGDYGYMVNQIVEHDLLLEDLPACKKEKREPSYYLTPYNKETENGGIGKSYIEVDLAAQHIWCYIDGKLKMDSDCVSGTATDGHATPTGVFGIMFMKKDATLRGVMQKNGEYEYETKVGYWMPFYDGCGFHDAWWRTAFGGDIYLRDGSHGCINLPVDAAETLFSYCDVKMPVVVYE